MAGLKVRAFMKHGKKATRATPPSLPTSSLSITQEQINRYAQLSNDFNPLHVDVEFAGKSIFGGTIAHGTIPLACLLHSLAALCGEPWLKGAHVSVKFIAPARPGNVITAQGKLSGQTADQDGIRAVYDVSCQNQQGQSIIVGTAEIAL